MRIGICASIEDMDEALAAGADFIEIKNTIYGIQSDEEFEKSCAIAAAHPGVALASNFLIPGELRLTGPDVDTDAVRAFCVKSFARLARLGVRILVFGSAKAKIVPEGFSFAEAWDQLVEAVRIFSDVAADNGQTVVIEPVRREECNIINTVEDSVKLTQLVNRDNVKAHVDFFHLMQNGETLSQLAPLVRYIGHVHIASPVKRTPPTFDDGANYRAFFDTLRAGGYDGTVSYEGERMPERETIKTFKTLISFLRSL